MRAFSILVGCIMLSYSGLLLLYAFVLLDTVLVMY